MTFQEATTWTIGAAIIWCCLAVTLVIQKKHRFRFSIQEIAGFDGSDRLTWALFAVAPLLEETLLCLLIRPQVGVWSAALWFGVLHGVGPVKGSAVAKVVVTTFVGLMGGYAWQTAGLPGALAIHYGWNAVAGLMAPVLLVWLTRKKPEPKPEPDLLSLASEMRLKNEELLRSSGVLVETPLPVEEGGPGVGDACSPWEP